MSTHPWFGPGPAVVPDVPAAEVRAVVGSAVADLDAAVLDALPAAPIVIPRSSYAELFRVGRALVDLVRRAALETAPSTAGRIEAYGVGDDEASLFLDDQWTEEAYAACMARPDVVVGPAGPRFIELNFSGAVGGLPEWHARADAWDRLLPERFAAGIGDDRPFDARCRLFADVCGELDLPRRLLFVATVRDLIATDSTRPFDMELDHLRSRGFEAERAEPEDLDDALGPGSQPAFALGLRQFTVHEWRALGIDTDPVRHALKRGCLLLSTQTDTFLANKLTLGLLSEGRPWMSDADRDLVDRYVPWTRVLDDRWTTRRGRRVDLVPFALAHQDELVLKQGMGMSGREVVVGWDADPGDWQRQVTDAAARRDSVVQEYVQPARCATALSPSDEDPEVRTVEVAPVISPFLFGAHRGGAYARYVTGDDRCAVVSCRARGAVENTVVPAP